MALECENSKEKLVFYMDGELSRWEMLEMEAHVAECQDCQAATERVKAVQAKLSLLPVRDLPAGFEARFWARARGKRSAQGFWGVPFPTAIGAAALLALVLGSFSGLLTSRLEKKGVFNKESYFASLEVGGLDSGAINEAYLNINAKENK